MNKTKKVRLLILIDGHLPIEIFYIQKLTSKASRYTFINQKLIMIDKNLKNFKTNFLKDFFTLLMNH